MCISNMCISHFDTEDWSTMNPTQDPTLCPTVHTVECGSYLDTTVFPSLVTFVDPGLVLKVDPVLGPTFDLRSYPGSYHGSYPGP
jgi:hypothetical protein